MQYLRKTGLALLSQTCQIRSLSSLAEAHHKAERTVELKLVLTTAGVTWNKSVILCDALFHQSQFYSFFHLSLHLFFLFHFPPFCQWHSFGILHCFHPELLELYSSLKKKPKAGHVSLCDFCFSETINWKHVQDSWKFLFWHSLLNVMLTDTTLGVAAATYSPINFLANNDYICECKWHLLLPVNVSAVNTISYFKTQINIESFAYEVQNKC